jgi:predicted metal-dependent peptidase
MKTPEVKDKETHRKVREALSDLVKDYVFWGSIGLRMPLIEDYTCETVWTDGEKQGYNPDFMMSLLDVEVKFVLAHEICHVVLLHHLRRGKRDHDKWNIACDFAVNATLKDSGFKLPKEAPYDRKYTGMNVEQIYTMRELEEEQNQPPEPQKPEPSKPEESEEPEPEEDEQEPKEEQDDSQDEEEGEKDEQGEGEDEESDEEGDSGNGRGEDGEDGSEDDEEVGQGQGQGDPGKCGEVRDAPSEAASLSESEITEKEAEMKVAISQAEKLQVAFAGSMPRGLARYVQDILDPQIPWEEVLLKFAQTHAKSDYNWSRPSKKYLHHNLYLPGLHSDEIDEIILAVDTSASQRQHDLDKCAGAIEGILATFNTKLTVLYCDYVMHEPEEFTRDDLPLKLHMAGSGGTSFDPPFDWVEKEQRRPTCFIYLTDGECNTHRPEPDYPVLWIGTRTVFTPPFGELVMMR